MMAREGAMPTNPTVIRIGKARVVARDPPRSIPPGDRWPVRFLEHTDINVLYKNIPSNKRILAGFLRGGNSWIPVYYHADFLLGPEAAHVNISGKTGLAVKTSYGVFLSYTVLTWAKNREEPTAVIMLNVKRGDLMRLHKLPSRMEDAQNEIKEWAERVGLSNKADIYVKLWKFTYEKEEVNPFSINIKYFTYATDPFLKLLQGAEQQLYSYGLEDSGGF